jgi:superfamily I DNA/RNA helicase
MKYLKDLNPSQLSAVKATSGRVLVLAGAGSGKTSVLIARILYLVNELNTPPSEILGLTFTNKAAREMRERLSLHLPKMVARQINLCTFHSFCFHLLKKEIHHLGYTEKFSLYDEGDIRRIVQDLLKHHNQDLEVIPVNDDILASIKSIQSGTTPKIDKNHKAAKLLPDVANDLATSMRAFNAVDFDGLINLTLSLFDQFPEVLSHYQKQYRYIMIDEYQDTNKPQYRIAKALSNHHQNLCVVGDDDQSIYGWRGAEIKHILEFEYDTLVKLEQNYRSTPVILEAANHVIKNNTARHDKTMWSSKKEADSIHIFHAPNEASEAEGVVARILKLRKELGVEWNEMAVLYRSSVLTRPLEVALMNASWRSTEGDFKRGIPYKIAEGNEFYSRAEIKDLLSYLRFIENPLDQEALLRIINYPRRGISNQTIDTLTQINRKAGIPLIDLLYDVAYKGAHQDVLSSSARPAIAHFLDLIEGARRNFEEKPLHTALKELISQTGYLEAALSDTLSEKAIQFKTANINQLSELISNYEKESEEPSLHDFIHTSMLDTRYTGGDRPNRNELNLLTFHSAKGLEFRACFIIGAEDHLIPHEKSSLDTGVEEERRLLYVAMTRAKEYLTISMARERTRYGKPQPSSPSRFLHEIPKKLLQPSSFDHPAPYSMQYLSMT